MPPAIVPISLTNDIEDIEFKIRVIHSNSDGNPIGQLRLIAKSIRPPVGQVSAAEHLMPQSSTRANVMQKILEMGLEPFESSDPKAQRINLRVL